MTQPHRVLYGRIDRADGETHTPESGAFKPIDRELATFGDQLEAVEADGGGVDGGEARAEPEASGGSASAAGTASTEGAATAEPRFDATAFVDRTVDEIGADLRSGEFDDHLGAIRAAEKAREADTRSTVTDALASREDTASS
jgi:hypothetical protein